MVFFINLTFNDLSGNIHGNAADLAFDFIDRFLFLLGNLFFCLVFQAAACSEASFTIFSLCSVAVFLALSRISLAFSLAPAYSAHIPL